MNVTTKITKASVADKKTAVFFRGDQSGAIYVKVTNGGYVAITKGTGSYGIDIGYNNSSDALLSPFVGTVEIKVSA